MPKYDYKFIESKRQKIWQDKNVFKVSDDSAKPKYYCLDMFPYPSSDGLHLGHPVGYTASDIVARFKSMQGFNVLHPMGFDAFGLPAENFAIKKGVHPAVTTAKNITNFKNQLNMLGYAYDWSRAVDTSSPTYYKWTQHIFLLLYKNGLAYKKKAPVNWCLSCQTVLANEQVINGTCERCKNTVIQKELSQWFFKITDYADRLLDGLDNIDWPDKIKAMQRNWIGRSEGAEIDFAGQTANGAKFKLTVFTTRPDTLFGVSAIVVAPEHPIIESIMAEAERGAITTYIEATKRKSELERTSTDQAKTGVFTGSHAKHPFTGAEVPIYVADYVLPQYGTGAIMLVPAHDERDHAFAKTYGLAITTVVEPVTGTPQENPEHRQSIVALVEDPLNKKVLVINWGSTLGGYLLVGGGRDQNENAEVCARREILEETGYADLELVSVSETIHHNYFAHSKNVARAIDATGLHFRLKSDQREETKLEANEEGKFTVEWLSFENAASKIADPLHAYVFQKFALGRPYTGDGILTGSGTFDGLTSSAARHKIVEALESKNQGREQVNYHLRDWLISRQRYWGAPIPIIYCERCGEVPVPEENLPVMLPTDVDFRPTGESPLTRSESFQNVVCPKCGQSAKREADTMDTFVDSSWYFLRYASPHCEVAAFDKSAVDYWCPIDMYIGGAEHAVLHLLYSRFFIKALFDLGYVKFEEPFLRLRNQGLILAEDGQKMSKSLGNVVNPDSVIAEYGADTLRMYIMFLTDFPDNKPWNTKGIAGISRFLDRIHDHVHEIMHGEKTVSSPEIIQMLHQTIKKVTLDIEACKFNTAISSLMIFHNAWLAEKSRDKNTADVFLKMLAPFAPHLAEELWASLSFGENILLAGWPIYDEILATPNQVEIVIQINGKIKAKVMAGVNESEESLKNLAFAEPTIVELIKDQPIKKTIVVKGRIVNIVI